MSKDLAVRIKELRTQKGYTQKELAALLGVGQTTIANYENGIRIPDTEKMNKIADLFQVSFDYLLGRTENRQVSNKKLKSNNFSVNSLDDSYKMFTELLIKGNKDEARRLVLELYEQHVEIEDIYIKELGRALKEVGLLWEKGIVDVWKEHYISEITLDIMKELKFMEKKEDTGGHTIVALTPGAELHNIGLRMITDILELKGYNVIYLGSNVPVQNLLEAIKIEKPELIIISVTIGCHIDSAKYMIEAIKNCFWQNPPKVIIGGYAFENNKKVLETTGADYYGLDANDIIKILD